MAAYFPITTERVSTLADHLVSQSLGRMFTENDCSMFLLLSVTSFSILPMKKSACFASGKCRFIIENLFGLAPRNHVS